MKLLKLIILLLAAINFSLIEYQPAIAQKAEFSVTDKGYKVIFPPGSFFKGILQYRISTETNNIGDRIDFVIPADIIIENVKCIPKGSRLIGKIIRLERAKIGRNGYVLIVVNTLKLPDDNEIDLIGHIWTKNDDGIIGGEFSEKTLYRRVPHYIADLGTVVKLVPAGPGKMGKDTELLPGSEWVISLERELEMLINNE